MKSKLFLMLSVLVAALMLTTSAYGQDRTGNPGGAVRTSRVDLPCTVTEIPAPKDGAGGIYGKRLRATMHNNTGSWLAEGKSIHFEVKTKLSSSTTVYVTYPSPTKMVLDGMIPVQGSALLLEKPKPLIQGWLESEIPPFTCTAWFIK